MSTPPAAGRYTSSLTTPCSTLRALPCAISSWPELTVKIWMSHANGYLQHKLDKSKSSPKHPKFTELDLNFFLTISLRTIRCSQARQTLHSDAVFVNIYVTIRMHFAKTTSVADRWACCERAPDSRPLLSCIAALWFFLVSWPQLLHTYKNETRKVVRALPGWGLVWNPEIL